ncbi:MAG: para-aminobenzoate synthetase component 1 [Oleispira sp.]|jgi:para-aminobenzoate synthetase component 1
MHLTNSGINKPMRHLTLKQFDSCELLTTLINISRSPSSHFRLQNISLLISKPIAAINTASPVKSKGERVYEDNNDRRFSFLCANPSQKICFYNDKEIDDWKKTLQHSSPFQKDVNNSTVPFHSGWMGYFSYPKSQIDNEIIAEFNYYPWSICFDQVRNHFYLLGEPDQAAKDAYAWLLSHASDSNESHNKIDQPLGFSHINESDHYVYSALFKAEPFKAQWRKDDYQKAFSKVQNYLLAGDCYQVNLTHPFVSPQYKGSAISTLQPLFDALKPSFGCYFQGENCELVSMSPERFISINRAGKLEAKPIKGTIKRSDDSVLDDQLIAELSNSAKNKAENLMIVDLLRNDLSMSAIPGSVNVDKLFELESHPNVHHLVSTISAQLKTNISPAEAIRNAFPGGSITGAPKKRAMEIIEELEVQSRSLYCGSFGYFSDTGNADFNILIRSLEFRDNTITCWGGGGITVDSNCDEEYEESLTKIKRIMDVVEGL